MALAEGTFYRRPLAGLPIRYGNQVVGVNKLKNMVKEQEKQKRVAAVLDHRPHSTNDDKKENIQPKKVQLET